MDCPASNRLRISGSLFLLSTVVPFAACKKKDADAAPPPPPAVLTAPATSRSVNIVRNWTGALDGSKNVDIRPRVSGYLLSRDYQEGRPVKKGDLLFTIDPRPFEAQLQQVEADHLMAIAQRTKAEQDVARYRPLAEKQAISKEELEHAIQAQEAANAKVAAALAVIEQAKLNLGFTKIVSEIDGVAGFANREIGDLVGSLDSKPLTTVSTVDPIKVSFQISEQEYLATQREREKAGIPADDVPKVTLGLTLADGHHHPHPGKLISISREVNNQTGTFQLTAYFANPGNILRPGQFARVDAVMGTIDAVLVPQRAVTEVQGSYQVALVMDGKAEIRPVTTGPREGTDWVIESGLKAGETVIVEGAMKVRGGMPVQASPWTPPAAGDQPKPEGK
ncbi:efflux RND transporter periplasmic adaptor subunit [Luteolibacter arcticus]|uniref:Efflux RND transporter periplasmic adaptor subunit n=1 Tax=Luteolibacter arcticus TaxID=1581411 RepID=A0ABT3GMH2_9BACT|nr:efflux RND transporter periplasmic adaptor subunit [Luteolibacter arcticus]MCW1924724.1 efflux RND transporter periplasmic adaptor subunit [Luteolibacter arcticus]